MYRLATLILALSGCAISDPGAPEERWELESEFVTPTEDATCWVVLVGPKGTLALEPTGKVTERKFPPNAPGEIWRNTLSADEGALWFQTNRCE